ncbi:MAG: hypothetical protein ACK5LL_16515 [Suipraeoptans sp.]
MIMYTTKFPTSDLLSREEFIKTVIKWNQGSQYDKIEGVEWDGQSNDLKWSSEKISLEFQEVETDGIISSRLRKEDEHGVWTTDFVLNVERKYLSVSVELVTTEFTTDFSPSFYPPYFVKLIVYGGYAGSDADLLVSQKAYNIIDCETLTENVIQRKTKMMLPIVYISRLVDKESNLNVDDLAFRLQGVAHVIYEPENYEKNVKVDIAENKDYFGKVFIFYPSKNKKNGMLSYFDTDQSKEWVENRISNDVYSYINQRIRKNIDTWDGVLNEQLHFQNIELLKTKESVEEENDQLYEEFGNQLTKMEATNSKLNGEIQRLTAEVQGLRLKMADKGQVPMLLSGEEKEFYSGEIKEIVLEILDDYLKTCYEGSRREHVISDLIENNEFMHLPEKRKETLKKALKGYRTLNGSLKSDLEALGFEITSDGKHYKWSYFGDNRYVATVSKTSSDGRAGMNMAATMEKLMF